MRISDTISTNGMHAFRDEVLTSEHIHWRRDKMNSKY